MSKRVSTVSTSTEYRRRKKKLVLAYSGVKQGFQDELQGHSDKSDLESDNNTEPDSNFLQEQDGEDSYREGLTGNDEVECNIEEKKFQSQSPPTVNVLQGSDGEMNCHYLEDDMQSFEVHDDILSYVTSDEEESEDSDYHDCSDLEVLFLNENMDMQDGDDPPFPEDPESDLETSLSSDDGSSDPDEPSSPSSAASFSSSSSSSSSSDEDSDNEPFFNFNNKPALNRAAHFNRYRTPISGPTSP
ncbi:Protein M35 [Frankliniella fusca]|uniref:Protein M35 n=1 Tax=Frankliniella fusca TaxID=407009 RepID=A0AAE1LB08_9NEOP|nr:Protein M35 [Frankliniella fusca]